MIIRLPGFFDPHVHIREPGQEYKETWETGSQAALAGGIVSIGVMPNLKIPITNEKVLKNVIEIADKNCECNYGIFMGASKDNYLYVNEIAKKDKILGLKLYMNDTFGDMKIDEKEIIEKHLINWTCNKPIVVHCEYDQMLLILDLALKYGRRIHIAHISNVKQLLLLKKFKERGLNITSEITPHHLLLNKDTFVKPQIEKNKLINYLKEIDCIATDHAPHLKEENKPGICGLETCVSLFLDLVDKGYLTLDRMVEMMYKNPYKIFNLKEPENTYIEIDTDYIWKIKIKYSKCGWSPFEENIVKGKVIKTVLNGKILYLNKE